MSEQDSLLSSKRVAKNTVFLYVRMLFTLIISLFTSRILLNTLGVDDFGIYNVVAGIVVLFSFLQSAFATSTTRFIGVAITKENQTEEVSKVYYTAYAMHISLALLFIIGLESVGIWYMDNYMNIPYERVNAAFWVFHLAVVNTCLLTLRVTDQSMIVAFEKMNFFAICGIVEAVLKLVIVYMVMISPFDKLISYSCLMVIINMLINVAYFIYTHRLISIKLQIIRPQGDVVKGMFSLIGWNSLGGVANIGYQQGISLILNFFYGVALNAAMGIANQVKTAVFSFVSNIRVASDPQIIKSYAMNEFEYCRLLMSRISRLSHYFLLLIAVPVIINVDFILELWLKNPPEYSSSFVVLMLVYCILDGLMGPLWIVNQATGKIRKYQIIRAVFYFSNIPITFAIMKMYAIPQLVIVVGIVLTVVLFFIQIPICTKPIGMSIITYCREVLIPILVVSVISVTITYYCGILFNNPWVRLISTTVINTLVLGGSVYVLGINKEERKQALDYMRNKLSLYIHR